MILFPEKAFPLIRLLTTQMFTFTRKCLKHHYKRPTNLHFKAILAFGVTKMALGYTRYTCNTVVRVLHLTWDNTLCRSNGGSSDSALQPSIESLRNSAGRVFSQLSWMLNLNLYSLRWVALKTKFIIIWMVLKASIKKTNNLCRLFQSKNQFFILKIKPHWRNEWISVMLFLYNMLELKYQNQNLLQ